MNDEVLAIKFQEEVSRLKKEIIEDVKSRPPSTIKYNDYLKYHREADIVIDKNFSKYNLGVPFNIKDGHKVLFIGRTIAKRIDDKTSYNFFLRCCELGYIGNYNIITTCQKARLVKCPVKTYLKKHVVSKFSRNKSGINIVPNLNPKEIFTTFNGEPAFNDKWVPKLIAGEPLIISTKNIKIIFAILHYLKAVKGANIEGLPINIIVNVSGYGKSWLEPNVPDWTETEYFTNSLTKLIPNVSITINVSPVIISEAGYRMANYMKSKFEHMGLPIMFSEIFLNYRAYNRIVEASRFKMKSGEKNKIKLNMPGQEVCNPGGCKNGCLYCSLM